MLGELRRVVAGSALVGDVTRDRRDRQDVRTAGIRSSRSKQREQCGDHALGSEHVDVEHPLPVIGVAILDRRQAERAPGVVDQAMERTAGCDVVTQRVDVGLLGEVGDENVHAGLGGERLQPVLAPSDRDHIPAVLGEQASRRRTNPRTCPGDHYASLCHVPSLLSDRDPSCGPSEASGRATTRVSRWVC